MPCTTAARGGAGLDEGKGKDIQHVPNNRRTLYYNTNAADTIARTSTNYQKILYRTQNINMYPNFTTTTDYLGHEKIDPGRRSREERKEGGAALVAAAVAEGLLQGDGKRSRIASGEKLDNGRTKSMLPYQDGKAREGVVCYQITVEYLANGQLQPAGAGSNTPRLDRHNSICTQV